MERELYCCTSQQRDGDSANITQDDQNLGSKPLKNISVQTGEEFSPEFLRDHSKSRGTPSMKDVDQIPKNIPIRRRRRDSETRLESSDFSPSKGYGFDVEYNTYLNGVSRHYREFQAGPEHQRKFSDDIDRAGPPFYSSDSPNSYQSYIEGSRYQDRPFSGKMKFLCSFGGRILPRPSDGKLRYVGGETRVISIRKNLTYFELLKKTTATCTHPHIIKYQLPGEDLDALVSVCSDEDLHHMIEEYHDLERTSQRLRLFLVSTCDPESPCSLEARTMQQSDADYQYVFAVNGMLDPSHQRSSSRESLSSHLGGILDGSPTLQRDFPTPFVHSDKKNGGSFSNLKAALSSSTSQPINVPKSYYIRGYEDATCPDGCEYTRKYTMDNSLVIGSPNKNSHMLESHATPTLLSHFRNPSTGFDSPTYHLGGFDERRGFLDALQRQDAERANLSLEERRDESHLSSVVERLPSIAVSNSSQEWVRQHKPIAQEKYQTLGNKDQLSPEIQDVNKEWIKKREATFDQNNENHATSDEYASDADFPTQRQNLAKIMCPPDSNRTSHVPISLSRVNRGNDSASSCNSVEDSREVWQELPGNYQLSQSELESPFKSQKSTNEWKHYISDAIDCRDEFSLGQEVSVHEEKMDNYHERRLKDSDHIVQKEKPGMDSNKKLNSRKSILLHSKSSDNCHETGMLVVGEEASSSVSHSKAIPHIRGEHVDGNESPGEETEAESASPESGHEV